MIFHTYYGETKSFKTLFFTAMLKDNISTSMEKMTMLPSTQTAASSSQKTSSTHALPTNPIEFTQIITSPVLSTLIQTTDKTEKITPESTHEETTLLALSPLTTILRSTDQTTIEHLQMSGK